MQKLFFSFLISFFSGEKKGKVYIKNKVISPCQVNDKKIKAGDYWARYFGAFSEYAES